MVTSLYILSMETSIYKLLVLEVDLVSKKPEISPQNTNLKRSGDSLVGPLLDSLDGLALLGDHLSEGHLEGTSTRH